MVPRGVGLVSFAKEWPSGFVFGSFAIGGVVSGILGRLVEAVLFVRVHGIGNFL